MNKHLPDCRAHSGHACDCWPKQVEELTKNAPPVAPAKGLIDWTKPIRTVDGRGAQLVHICQCGRCDYPVKVIISEPGAKQLRDACVDMFGHAERHGIRTGNDIINSDPSFMLEAEELHRGKRRCRAD